MIKVMRVSRSKQGKIKETEKVFETYNKAVAAERNYIQRYSANHIESRIYIDDELKEVITSVPAVPVSPSAPSKSTAPDTSSVSAAPSESSSPTVTGTATGGKVYGYARISTAKQSIERQIRNIKEAYKDVHIVQEIGTATEIEKRLKFKQLIKIVKAGDTIVFDSVSRMSRNAAEGFKLYQELFKKGVELVFLKERHIDTATYKEAFNINIGLTGTELDYILEGINKYLFALAEKQIILAFEQSQKEVDDLKQRTREGIETARLKGKTIGNEKGTKLVTKKSLAMKEEIKKYSKFFQGTLNDIDVMKITRLSRNTYYKYKKELLNELYYFSATDISVEESTIKSPLSVKA